MDKKSQNVSDNQKTQSVENPPSKWLASQIKKAAEDLSYTSETDAEISPFVGQTANTANAQEVLKQTGAAADVPVEEKDFDDFFSRMTKIQDWFGDEEKATAQKFVELKAVLENNIRDLKVYKIGKVNIDIYVVGLDAENTLIGVQTKAVET